MLRPDTVSLPLGVGQVVSFKPPASQEGAEKKADDQADADDQVVASYQQIAELAAKLRMGVSMYPSRGKAGFFAGLTHQKQEVFIAICGATDVFSVMKAFAGVAAHAEATKSRSTHDHEDEGPDLGLAWYESESSWANRQLPMREIDLTRVFDAKLVQDESEVKVIVQYTDHDHHCGDVEVEERDNEDERISVVPHDACLSRHFDRQEVEFFFPTMECAHNWAEHLNELCDIVSHMDET